MNFLELMQITPPIFSLVNNSLNFRPFFNRALPIWSKPVLFLKSELDEYVYKLY